MLVLYAQSTGKVIISGRLKCDLKNPNITNKVSNQPQMICIGTVRVWKKKPCLELETVKSIYIPNQHWNMSVSLSLCLCLCVCLSLLNANINCCLLWIIVYRCFSQGIDVETGPTGPNATQPGIINVSFVRPLSLFLSHGCCYRKIIFPVHVSSAGHNFWLSKIFFF